MSGFAWIDAARRDVAYGVRMLRRQPLATAAATLSLAIGIGLNAAVFSVVDWVLLRPLPYPAPHQLVRVFTSGTALATGPQPLTPTEFVALSQSTSFRSLAAISTATRVLAGPGTGPVHVVLARVGGDLFGTLGVGAEAGRTFTSQELAAGAPVVVLRHELWQRRFSGDPDVIGRTITIDGAPQTIVGVMGRGRGYPADADVWRPLTAPEREDDDRELAVLARLTGEATTGSASAELAARANANSSGERTAWADDVQRTDAGNVRAAIAALFAAAMLILVIACANVAALVGARGADRAGEIAVRGALGATRGRLFAQLMIESLVLAAAGGLLGWLAGRWALDVLVAIAPVAIPRVAEIALDGRVLVFGLAATMLTGVAVGLLPALRMTRGMDAALHSSGWMRTTRRSHARRALVLVQIATAVVLTAGAGLLLRSLTHLVTFDHGFADRRLVAVEVSLRGARTIDAAALFRDLEAGAAAVPGVSAATMAMRLPTQVTGLRAAMQVAGQPEARGTAIMRPIGPAYFAVAGIPLHEGRAFSNQDTRETPRVAIVNGAFVRDVLSGRAAIGVRVTASLLDGPLIIVGVAGDVTPAGEPDRPAFYVPVDQVPIGGGYLLVRATGDPGAVIPALTASLRRAAPALALDRVRRVAEDLEESRAMTRFTTQLAAAFAVLALVLSAIGVYGLAAGEVAMRWRELAVRLALGASHRDAWWIAIRPCALVLAMGAAIGLLGAIAASPALSSLLQGVSASDAATLLVAPALLGATGLAAAALAAARVLRADPARTLRN